MKYSAFGEIRDINGSSPTDYKSKRRFDFKVNAQGIHSYTGQRKEVEFGLSYYVARWYDAEPMLNIGLREFASQILQDENLSFSSGHFVQADSLIPEPADSLIPELRNSDARIYIADFSLGGYAGDYPIPNEMTYIVSQKYFYREYFYNYYAPLIDEYHNL
ncbi:MAG: hypothetical protein K8R40_08235 [Anaerolineaceae bacterium]|nr:hypothetical protein [Anaerolineaceae bacterium]